MRRSLPSLKFQVLLLGICSLSLIWAMALYEINRNLQERLHQAEVRTSIEAHVFAEYSMSTLKRINEFILDVRNQWTGDWPAFATLIRQRQENIDDLSFQVAVIDRDGILAFSNLAKPSDRTDLSQREHFRVHKEAGNVDRLFISRPLKGKVSGKWSLQVTRPIFKHGEFQGVIVVSISPEQFAGFADKLRIGGNDVLLAVRSSGEIMARYPAVESALGMVLKDRPYLAPNAPLSGNFRQASSIDGVDRLFGYYRLPEYGLAFVIGAAVDDVLGSYDSQRLAMIAGAAGLSILAFALFLMLFRSFTALDMTRLQLDAIFALSPDGFVSFDAARRVTYINPAFDRMTGLSAATFIGLDEHAFTARLVPICLPHARFPELVNLRNALLPIHDGAATAQGWERQRQLVELAPPVCKVLEVGLRLSSSNAVSQILYLRDVTHETEVDRMKSEFLSTAAHELRTPMASIYGYAEVLLTQDFDVDTKRELLDTIYRQSGLMASIINELLDLARIDARRGKDLVFEATDLVELVDQALSGYKPPDDRNPPIFAWQAGLPRVNVDHEKIGQALINVISNAYKYSPQGRDVRVGYVTDLTAAVPMVGITVRDEGIGMTPEQQARVGERFYRADTSGKIPGTGLGMSIVRELIELHQGRVDIQSALGKGTLVTLWLPVFSTQPANHSNA